MRPRPSALVAFFLLPGCAGSCAPPDEDSGGPNAPIAVGDFALGVEYTQLGLAEPYAAVGVGWAKTRLEAFEWGQSEPAAPVGGVHSYDWRCTDALILAYQDAGIVNIQSYISPRSAWGSVDAAGASPVDIAPAPAFEADFRAWVHALIERYDGDGVDGAPGLRAGVHHWVVGPEWTGFWPSGNADDYIEFATIVAEEARAANPDVHLGAMPIFFADEFSGNEPNEAEIEAKMGAPYTLRNDNSGIEAILDHSELFDSISVHALGDYTELPPMLRWFRAQMETRGYDHPIWLDDAFPAGVLANGASYPTNYPVTAESYPEVYALLRALARGEAWEGYTPEEALDWVLAYYGAHTVKKVITTLGEGASGIMIGNTEDWMFDEGASLRDAQVFLIGGAAAMGMTEVNHDGGYDICDEREAGAARPALSNIGLLVDFLGVEAFDEVERIGGNEGARGYALRREGGSRWVLWNEDGELHLPGDPAEAVLRYELAVPAGVEALRVTRAVTVAGAAVEDETVPVAEGVAVLELSSTPLLIVPD
jgi:hypothetical protein